MSEVDKNMTNERNESVYELALLLDPKMSEEKASVRLNEFKMMSEKAGAEFIALGEPVLKSLAYMMTLRRDEKRQDFTKAHFGWVKFALDKSVLANLEAEIKAQSDVVRYLIVKTVREDTKRVEPVKPIEIPEELQTTPSAPASRVKEEEVPISEKKLDEALEEIVV